MKSRNPAETTKLPSALVESILVMQNDFIRRGISYGWCNRTIENLLSLTESQFGFICELLETDDGTPFIRSHGITNIAWSEQTQEFYEENKKTGLDFFNFDSLWGRAITTGAAVIANDPDHDERCGGYPKEQGHPPLTSFLAIPIEGTNGEVVGVMGVANRPGGYDEQLVDFLDPFVSSYGVLIEKYRAEEELRTSNEQLRATQQQLQAANRALEDSERLLNETGDMARVGGWEIDLDANMVRWTRTTRAIHEVPDDHEPTLEEAIDFFPEVRDELTEAIRRAREDGTPYDMELPFVTATGARRWVRTIGQSELRDGQCVRLHGVFQDITERRQADLRFRIAQDMSPDGFAILRPVRDASGRVVDFTWVYENAAVARLKGTDPEAVVGKRLLELLPGHRDSPFLAAYQRVAHTGEPCTLEEVYAGESLPRPTWFRVVVVPMDGDIAVLAQDITERVEAAAKSREAALTRQLAASAGNVGIFDWDLRTDRLVLSREWKSQLGYEEHEIGDTIDEWRNRLAPADKPRVEQEIRKVIDGRLQEYPAEYLLRHKDGSYRWILFRGSLITDAEGEPARVLGAHIDITEQKKAEEGMQAANQQLEAANQQLRATEQQLRASNQQLEAANQQLRAAQQRLRRLVAALEQGENIAGTGFFERNWQTGEGSWSRGFWRLLGLEPRMDAESHADFMRFVHEEDAERVAAHVKSTLRNHDPMNIEFRIVRPTGEVVEIHGVAENHYDEDGRPLLTRGTFQDVTESRQMQAQLALADRLSSMGTLAAGVAHEINNPLTYTLCNLEAVVEELPGLLAGRGGAADNDTLVRHAQEALEGAQRIWGIARTLGTFARVEDDEVQPVNVRHAVENASNMAHNEIKYRAKLVLDLPPNSAVLGSEGKLSQVFLNLLINAAQAIDEGDVEGNTIHVRSHEDGDHVVIEVSDTGEGISKENTGRLFEPFFTTKAVGEGSGLGLSISRKIVTEMGGEIDCESEKGKGTTFRIRLPLMSSGPGRAPARDASASERIAEPLRGRILAVDDEAGIRAVMARMLGSNHEVLTAASGAEGQALLEKDQAFDLIILDLMMPEVSGMDLHRWLSEHHPELARRVIFVTGGVFTPGARAYLAQVDNMRVEKPLETATFKELVAKFIASRANSRAD